MTQRTTNYNYTVIQRHSYGFTRTAMQTQWYGGPLLDKERAKKIVEHKRSIENSLFFGPTIPEAHKLTGYGLFLAGGEYFDHLRNFRTQDSYVKRTLLSDNPAKANLSKTIREIAAVA